MTHNEYRNGYQAYWLGQCLTTNPHNTSTREFNQWFDGWLDARDYDDRISMGH